MTLLQGRGPRNDDGAMETTSFARFTFDPESPLHRFHQARGNRESQTRAAVLPRGRVVGLRERLEDRLLLVERNTDARVSHLTMEAQLVCLVGLHCDLQRNFAP